MAYVPRNRRQLGRGATSSVDCGPRMVQVAMHYGRKSDAGVPTIANVRLRMNHPGAQPTNVWDQHAALTGYDRTQAWLNFRPEGVKRALRNGRLVLLSVSYRRLRNELARVGSRTFMGGHSTALYGLWRNDEGHLVTRFYDPLDDGRMSGVPDAPRGRVVRYDRVMDAAKAFGTPGTPIYSVIVGRR